MLYEIDGQRPNVDDGAFVAPTASIIGDVSIAAGASVWFGAVARGDGGAISLGAGSNLQDNAVIHADPGFPASIGADVSIGHGAVVHGCTIGDRVLVGMGATIMNGATVGSDTLIAAGALVSPGVEIPPRSLVVGVPGKVRRTLTEDEVDAVASNAHRYVERAEQYRASGKALET
ncbi:gamma carbonic anhydrase family protein [Propioniciclava sp.]|uniref:gamma carbonic anhydrase family protein n=1 Tax=Propioniciclava sp. TaxID=2038686 RepID=UPI00262BBCFF|nr:gamma carbonic anhydrase family protein [Propioniciclava sp.]